MKELILSIISVGLVFNIGEAQESKKGFNIAFKEPPVRPEFYRNKIQVPLFKEREEMKKKVIQQEKWNKTKRVIGYTLALIASTILAGALIKKSLEKKNPEKDYRWGFVYWRTNKKDLHYPREYYE